MIPPAPTPRSSSSGCAAASPACFAWDRLYPAWGARERAATLSERCGHVMLSAERCLKGPSRSCHGEGNRQHSGGPERMLDLSGVWGGGTFPEESAEQERPYLAAKSGEDRAYKAGRPKSRGARRESEGSVVPMKACKTTRI